MTDADLRIAEVLERLHARSLRTRRQAARSVEQTLHSLPAADTQLRPRLETALLERLHVEPDRETRWSISRSLCASIAWALQYGSPAERRSAVRRITLLSEGQPADFIDVLEGLLLAQSQREPLRDLQRGMRVAVVALRAGRIQRRSRHACSRLIVIGKTLKNIRLRAGLSRSAVCEAAGIHNTTLGFIEAAGREEPLMNYVKVLQALGDASTPEERALFYEQWNTDLARFPWFDAGRSVYAVRTVDGMPLGETLKLSLADFIRSRLRDLKLRATHIAAASGLPQDRISGLLRGRIKRPAVSMLRKLAKPLRADLGLLYLLAHPELPYFMEIVDTGSRDVVPRRSGLPAFAGVRLGAPPPVALTTDQALIFERLDLKTRAAYKSAILKYLRYDPESDAVCIEMPSEAAIERAAELDLAAMLSRSIAASGLTWRRFFRSSPISATSFRNVAKGRSIPSERHLGFLEALFGEPPACFLLSSLRLCGRMVVARCPERAGQVDPDVGGGAGSISSNPPPTSPWP